MKTFIVDISDTASLAESMEFPKSVSYFIIVYVWTISILGIVGNTVATIVFKNMLYENNGDVDSREIRKPLFILLINLSVTDLIMIITNYIVSGLSWIFGKWVFGTTMCVIMTFFTTGFGMIGWQTITTMVVFKLYRLLCPFSTLVTVKRMKLLVLSCWVTAFIFPAIWSNPYRVRYISSVGNCIFYNNRNGHPIFYMIGSIIIILNFLLLIASNCTILWIVKYKSRSGSIGKALRLILMISSLFLISNILVVYMTISTFFGSAVTDFDGILIWSYLLFQFNTFINPIMYCFIQPSFKNYVIKMIKKIRRVSSSANNNRFQT